jgi:hypothetical protein
MTRTNYPKGRVLSISSDCKKIHTKDKKIRCNLYRGLVCATFSKFLPAFTGRLRVVAMSDIRFSNFQLEKDTEYFLYIGELKNYWLNRFLVDTLANVCNRKFDFIAIVPDVFEQYNYENLIVINPLIHSFTSKFGPNVCCRVSSKDFMSCVSNNRQVKSLIKQLLTRQHHLYIYMYESLPEMTLDEIPGVSILGPSKTVAHRINSKIYQHEKLKGRLPLVDFRICENYEDLIKTVDSLWERWTDGIFVSKEYSAAGVNSMIAHSTSEVATIFFETGEPFFISRYIPHNADPTVLAVAANEGDIFIAGIADQHIEGGNRFTGSTFPSVLSHSTCEKLKEYTSITGKWLAGEGYRGIFGCDYLVDKDENIYFLEINARKQGTTLEFCCTLEQSLPKGSPTLTELEYYAVTENLFPANTVEMRDNSRNLHWGTYNYKLKNTVHTNGYFPQYSGEREAFKRVADGKLKKDFMILEHTGSDFIVAEGSFIGRIVALGQDHESVRQGLSQGIKAIELTIDQQMIAEK